MTSTSKLKLFFLFLFFALFSCGDNDDDSYYSEWTSIGNGLNSNVTKNVLTEFVGSTNCPYCPASDAKLLSYFDSNSDEYVGSDITKKWFLINYHTNSPSRGDPMYEFHRGVSDTGEDDYCYIRFEEGNWYEISGVPTTYTNGIRTSIYPEMALEPMEQQTPIQISLSGTKIEGSNINVRVSIKSSIDMVSSDSLHLFICATMDNVIYAGYNQEPEHQDVFLGWITNGLEGELISIGKEKIAKNYSWEMPSNWPQNNYETSWPQVGWDDSNLAVVAFIQNKYTKKIVQVSGKK
tara:strand:- start:715 stop:1593 length:879 start_codon:yes stop_codon:yes gene_type:complete